MSDKTEWNYILIFSSAIGSRESVKTFLNSCEEITSWYVCMNNTFFIRSYNTAPDLSDTFREFTKDRGRFLILDCETDRGGWLPRKAWDFMKSK